MERGSTASVVAGFIMLGLLCVGLAALSAWALGERATYKNNSDQIVADVIKQNSQKIKTELQKDFDEKEKSPYRLYSGPEEYGSLKIVYPKTWSVYVQQDGGQPLDVYMNPGFVESTQQQSSTYALRVQVVTNSYSETLNSFSGADGLKVAPYKLPQNQKIIGSKVSGKIDGQKQVTMVVVPLRDKTLKVWTENSQGATDFESIILKNFNFAP